MAPKALDNSDRVNVCKGDSGGPLMCEGPQKSTYEICGIVSFGRRDCTRDYTNVTFSQLHICSEGGGPGGPM